jgi:hypothetical protein
MSVKRSLMLHRMDHRFRHSSTGLKHQMGLGFYAKNRANMRVELRACNKTLPRLGGATCPIKALNDQMKGKHS